MEGNYNHHAPDPLASETRAHTIYVPVAVFLVVCPLFVGARLWARLRKGGKLGADDATILTSLVCGCFHNPSFDEK